MKKFKVTMQVVLCLLLAVVLFQVQEHDATASALQEYKVVVDGGTDVSKTSANDMNEASMTLKVVKIDGSDIDPDAVVSWSTSEEKVISIDPKNVNTTVLTRKGPGFTNIDVTVDGKLVGTYKFMIDFEIDYDTSKVLELDADPVSVNYSKNIKFKYTDSAETEIPNNIYKDVFNWQFGNSDIAEVIFGASDTVIRAKGAGNTNIYISASTADPAALPKIGLAVTVHPSFKLNSSTGESSKLYKNIKVPETHTPVRVDDWNFNLRLDYGDVSNVVWKVKDASTGMDIALDGSGKITMEPLGVGKVVNFSNVKAGVYDIYAYSGINYIYPDSEVSYAFMRVVVPIKFKQDNIIMSVGDKYNIVDNSNIHSLDVIEDNSLSTTWDILEDYSDAGYYEAGKKGNTQVRLRYNHTKGNLYPAYLETNFPGLNISKEFFINVSVIDKISLNMTTANIYENGTFRLKAFVSNPDLRVEWRSSNPLLTVEAIEGTDKEINVKAGNISTGTAPSVTARITATLMDNHGVIKVVTCDVVVNRSVTNISINPSDVYMHIGDKVILTGIITPAVLNAQVDLQWQSSDDSVVSLNKTSFTVAEITALKAGRATITAIDQNNVVVGYSQVIVTEPVISIELSETKIDTDLNTKYIQLQVTFNPSNATNKNVNWLSTDDKIASVDENGVINIKGTGDVSIIATSEDNPNAKAICNITIHTPVMALTMERPDLTLKVGDSTQLTYILLPVDATNKSVAWSSSNPTIADVDASGKVTAKSAGNAVIMLRSLDHGLTAYTTIKVTTGGTTESDAGFKFDIEEIEMAVGDEYEIKVTFEDKSMKVNDLRWASTNTGIVSVDHYGKLKANNPGVATVVATDDYGDRVTLKVTVVRTVDSILLNFTERAIKIGEKFTLDASVNPSNATRKKIVWVSSNPSVATITKNGVVEGITGGVTTITAKIEGEEVTATSKVTVNVDSTSIELNHSSYRLGLGERVNLKATVLPSFANQNVTWKSSNSKVATVNAQGRVVGISYGYATITATTKDGNEVEAYAEIEVVRPVNRIHISSGSLSMMVGDSAKLTATIEPKNSTYNNVIWTSSDDSIALVDGNGNILALKAGKATITASSDDGSGKKAICIVTIREGIPTTGITIMDKKVTMVPGETKNVKIVQTPANSPDSIAWSSDNSSVARATRVDGKTGKITARGPGIATITVMAESGKSATMQVNVIGLNISNITMEKYDRINNAITVEGTTSRVTWSIDNTRVATITRSGNNSLNIVSKAVGTATITATVDGRTFKCKLNVTSY